MQSKTNENVVITLHRPSGAPKKAPSPAMAEALEMLSQAEEMKVLIGNAREHRRKVNLQLFCSFEGHPVLLHFAVVQRGR